MELVYILLGVVSLISLICFFVLCANVGAIKARVKGADRNTIVSEFNKAQAFGEDEKAKELLKQLIWRDVLNINSQHQSESLRKETYPYLKEKYKGLLEKYNLTFFDEDIAAKF